MKYIPFIFGFYDAHFRDQYFFTHDMVYANTELRDMWEYQLKFSPEEKKLFLYHLMEIKNAQFQYYFFKQNCAYASVTLLEGVSDIKLLPKHTLWYAPIEPFIQLNTHKKNGKNFIEKIIFHPSREKQLFYKYSLLSHEEQTLTQHLIEKDLTNFIILKKRTQKEQIAILDFLLAYYKLKIIQADTQEKQHFKNCKNILLKARLSLPPEQNTQLPPQPVPKITPDQTAPPTSFTLEENYNIDSKKLYPSLSASLFSLYQLSTNTLNGDQLSLIEAKLSLHSATQDIRFMPKLALRVAKENLKLTAYTGYNISTQKDMYHFESEIETLLQISKKIGVYAHYLHKETTQISLGIRYFY